MKFFLPQSLLLVLLLSGCGDVTTGKPVGETSTAAEQTTEVVAEAVKAAIHPGKDLHDSNCISCHDSAVYAREDRKLRDFPQLKAQVRRCDANLGAGLLDKEIVQVAEYLNQSWYKFEF